jgi:hypothetical protein
MAAPSGNLSAPRHGARSERVVQPLAQKHARRLLRQRGIGAADLSPVGRALLQNWSRAAAGLALLDAHAAEHGLLDDDGEPRGFTRLYVQLLNAERSALRAMEDHLHAREPHSQLADIIHDIYGDGDEEQ